MCSMLTTFQHYMCQVTLMDLLLTATLALTVGFIYFRDWIQMTILERRYLTLKQHLGEGLRQLDQFKATQILITNAMAEETLLRYLMLRQRSCPPLPPEPQPPPRFSNKKINDPVLRAPTV